MANPLLYMVRLMQIIARLTGGVGNQMFQYATAFSIARRLRADIAVDTSCYDYTHEIGRSFQLKHFQISASELTRNRLSRFIYKLASAERPTLRPLAAMTRQLLRIKDVHEHTPHRYAAIQLPDGLRTSCRLQGYWQSPLYFHDQEAALRQEFHFREPSTGLTTEFLKQIQHTPNAVSVHVRRGDYLKVRPQAVLPTEYYRNATSRLRDSVPDPTFYLFSDDLPWACEHLALGGKTVPVALEPGAPAHEDLRLMSACQHHIIANSSFSWWGAWLNSASKKQVIAPRYWYGTPDSYYSDLYPAGWSVISQYNG
jgi:hypothetical protein